jgi:hypothetical protein
MEEEGGYMEEDEEAYMEEEYEEDYMGAEEDYMEGPGYEEGPPGGYLPPGYGAPGMGPGGGRSGSRQGFVVQLIRAVVSALGVNDSKTAHTTLKEVVEGTFETDDNRVATMATLETFVVHLCPEYEDLLYRCLTEPDKLRELGGGGQRRGPGSSPYGPSGDEMYGAGYPSGAAGAGRGPLSAEELQQHAFSVVAPKASEQFRARLAEHLAKPDTPQYYVDLFVDYLHDATPENVAAQMVLYRAPTILPETKEIIEENFLVFSSDALAGILGVPAESRARRRPRQRQRGGRGMYPGGPGYPGMEDEEAYMEDEYMGADADYMEGPGYEEAGPAGGFPMGPPGSGMAPGSTRGSGRPSRYDRQATGARPSRYDAAQPGALPGAQAPEMGRFQPADPDLPYRLAGQMWSGQMSKLVEGRLSQVDSLDNHARLLLLASTMPLDSTRSTLHQVLQRRWEDGPGGLESAGLFDAVISDPGFLVLVKMLPRKPPEQPTTPRPGLNRMRRGRTPGQRGAYGPAEEEEGMMGPDGEGYMMEDQQGPGRGPGRTPKEPDYAWMAASEELVRVVCERLLAAARAGGAQSEGELPFEVRADASVVAEYHLDWPAAEQEKLSGVPLGQMKLHYVRAELDTRLSTLESFYERQLSSTKLYPIHNGSWMESLGTVPDTDWKRSVDLMFTATVPAGQQLDKRAELPVTVDVLCIDIKNPQPAAAGS